MVNVTSQIHYIQTNFVQMINDDDDDDDDDDMQLASHVHLTQVTRA